MSPLLTASRMKDARSCQRLHHIKYGLGYRPARDAEALRFGTLVHQGLEAWWRAAHDAHGALDAALGAVHTAAADPFERVRAEVLLTGYDARWRAEPYEVLAVEVPFECDLVNPVTGARSRTWRLAGKLDAVVRDARGRVLIVEHKTSSEDVSPGSEYWRRLRMDGQVSVYFEGARALGFDVEGCLYDVLGKPGQKPLKATPPESLKLKKDGTPYANQRLQDETPAEYGDRVTEAVAADPDRFFARGEVSRLEAEKEASLADVWQLGVQLREAANASSYPRNPDACVRFGKTCSFFPVCSGEASLEDQRLYVRSDIVHPELAEASDAARG